MPRIFKRGASDSANDRSLCKSIENEHIHFHTATAIKNLICSKNTTFLTTAFLSLFLVLPVNQAQSGDVNCDPATNITAITCRFDNPAHDDIVDGTIDEADLGTNSVNTDELIDDSVTAAKLNPDVTGDGIAQDVDGKLIVRDGQGLGIQGNGALRVNGGDGIDINADAVNVDIEDNSLEIINGGLQVNVDDVTIETGAGGIQVKDLGITTSKIATDAVTSSKIAAGAVTTSKIATDAVTSSKIAAGAVTTSKIATDAVTSSKIAAGAVTTSKIATNAVTTSKIANDAVTSEKIANNTVMSEDIKDGDVQTVDLANNAVTTTKISNGAVTFNKLAPDVQNRITNLEDGVSDLKEGVALAIAIANAPVYLSGDKTFSLSLGLGFYDGETAGAFKGAVKLGQNAILSGSVAVSDNEVGGGVGVGFGF